MQSVKIWVIFVVCFMMSNLLVYAQTCPNPDVRAISCLSKNVTLSIPNTQFNVYDKYEISWGDSQSSIVNRGDSIVSHIYSTSLTYTLTVVGRKNDLSCSAASIFNFTPNGIPPYIASPLINKLEMNNEKMVEFLH
jgi:hypothetical protein